MKTATRWFKPLRGDPPWREIVAFDVEGAGGPGGFVCGAIHSADGSVPFWDRSDMWTALLERGVNGAWIFAHNLEYDLPIVAGEELWDGRLIFKDTGLLWADYRHRGRRVRLVDSGNLFPRWGVAALGDLVGLRKQPLAPGFLAGIASEHEHERLDGFDRLSLEPYCQRDAEIVYLAVELIQDLALSLGGSLQPTIAGVSMDVYRRTYLKWPWPTIGPEVNRLARRAFYGGRVEPFMMGSVEDVNLYDVTGLYPAVQAEARFPHPAHLALLEGKQVYQALERQEGVLAARLATPETLLPVLPTRVNGRLFFPLGELKGVWTFSEVRAALDRGYQLLEAEWAICSRTTFNPFERFISQLWLQRSGFLATENTRASLVKLILNSLYGRFGLDPEKGLTELKPIARRPRWNELKGRTTADLAGRVVSLGPVEELKQPAYVNVLFAAQIAAQARLRLLEALEGQAEDLVYCDTDSILTRGRLLEGDDLGEWRAQMIGGSADLIGPKEYILHNEVFGERYVVKGVPARVAEEYLKTGSARFRRAVRVREAIARGYNPSEWVEVLKERKPALPKRQPALTPWEQTLSWTLTVPWALSELREAMKGTSRWRVSQAKSRDEEFLPEWTRRLAEQLQVPASLLRKV